MDSREIEQTFFLNKMCRALQNVRLLSSSIIKIITQKTFQKKLSDFAVNILQLEMCFFLLLSKQRERRWTFAYLFFLVLWFTLKGVLVSNNSFERLLEDSGNVAKAFKGRVKIFSRYL